VELSIAMHYGNCCLQSTRTKKSFSAFYRPRRTQIRHLWYYSTTYSIWPTSIHIHVSM